MSTHAWRQRNANLFNSLVYILDPSPLQGSTRAFYPSLVCSVELYERDNANQHLFEVEVFQRISGRDAVFRVVRQHPRQ